MMATTPRERVFIEQHVEAHEAYFTARIDAAEPAVPVEAPAKVYSAPKPIAGERACALPECGVMFKLRSINSEERFCGMAHRTQYWRQAAQLGDRILRGGISVSGKSQKQCVLELLQEFAGKWVDRPLQRIPFVNWNVVSRLRKKGHRIECRMVWRDDIQRREYQYRLVP